MAWYQVCSGASTEELQDNVPDRYQVLPIGKRIKITYNTSPIPIASVFDLAGAELPAKLLAKGGKLIDASANGLFEIQLIVEGVEPAEAGFAQDDAGMEQTAAMAVPQVVIIIGVVAAVIVLAPLLIRMANLFADFVPNSGGDGGSGGGVFDYFKNLFGDYTPYVLIGGALLLLFLLKPSRRDQGPPAITYLLPGGK